MSNELQEVNDYLQARIVRMRKELTDREDTLISIRERIEKGCGMDIGCSDSIHYYSTRFEDGKNWAECGSECRKCKKVHYCDLCQAKKEVLDEIQNGAKRESPGQKFTRLLKKSNIKF